MIPRYTRPEMAAIWQPETCYRIWFEIEAHAADAHGRARHHAEIGRRHHLGKGSGKATLDVARIGEVGGE